MYNWIVVLLLGLLVGHDNPLFSSHGIPKYI